VSAARGNEDLAEGGARARFDPIMVRVIQSCHLGEEWERRRRLTIRARATAGNTLRHQT
jgi:hypothetical protein